MQQRLQEIGDWLDVNGEAIYGTQTWGDTCQWTDGKQPALDSGTYKAKYDVMKLTVQPDEGMATKEVFFTTKNDALYAICPVYPDGELVLKNVRAQSGATVTLLGHEGKLDWRQEGPNLVLTPPRLTPSQAPCQYAFVFKVSSVEDAATESK